MSNMGIVNDYINKIINKINEHRYDKEKPWLKYYDRMPEHLEYYNGSMYDMVNDTSVRYPNNIALEFFDVKYTYKEFIKKVDNVAISLKKLNIVENECVTICMPNIPEAIFIIYAVNKIGAICNVMHPLSSIRDIEDAMKETNSTTMFATDVSYSKLKDLEIKNLIMCEVSNSMKPLLKKLYNIKNRSNMKYKESVIRWNDFIKNENKLIETHVNRGKDSPAVIIYSGGTTGKSKGVILSNLCFNSIATQCTVVCKEAVAGNSIFSALPIFHGFGLCVCIHVPLAIGLKCILVPKVDVNKLNKMIKNKKPNLLPVIPSMLNYIIKNKKLGDKSFESVKVILSGGDYLSPELIDNTLKYFRECGSLTRIQIGYGLSEATAFISATCESVKSLDNIGIPNPDNIIKIFEPETDIELEYGSIGKICVNGPSVMLGYINKDEETANVLKTHYDGKLWLHTGDLGYMSEDGVIHYQSRLKRMIISNGYNIYPMELEEVINKCEYVETSVVVAMKHKDKGEVPKAVIVLKENIKPTKEIERTIKKYCQDNLSKFKIPQKYEFRETLPKTKIGKVDYKKLEQDK